MSSKKSITDDKLNQSLTKLTGLVENLVISMTKLDSRMEKIESKIEELESKSSKDEKSDDEEEIDEIVCMCVKREEAKELLTECCLMQVLDDHVIIEENPRSTKIKLVFLDKHEDVCLMELESTYFDNIMIKHVVPKEHKITKHTCEEIKFDLNHLENIRFYDAHELKFLTKHENYIYALPDTKTNKIKSNLTNPKELKKILEKYVVFSTYQNDTVSDILYYNGNCLKAGYWNMMVRGNPPCILALESISFLNEDVRARIEPYSVFKFKEDAHVTVYNKTDVSDIIEKYLAFR